jgi:hypothetical protein
MKPHLHLMTRGTLIAYSVACAIIGAVMAWAVLSYIWNNGKAF